MTEPTTPRDRDTRDVSYPWGNAPESTPSAEAEAVAEDAELAAVPVYDPEIAVYDGHDSNPNSMPVYEGVSSQLHKVVEPGVYRASVVDDGEVTGDTYVHVTGPQSIARPQPHGPVVNEPAAEPDADTRQAAGVEVDRSRQR